MWVLNIDKTEILFLNTFICTNDLNVFMIQIKKLILVKFELGIYR